MKTFHEKVKRRTNDIFMKFYELFMKFHLNSLKFNKREFRIFNKHDLRKSAQFFRQNYFLLSKCLLFLNNSEEAVPLFLNAQALDARYRSQKPLRKTPKEPV